MTRCPIPHCGSPIYLDDGEPRCLAAGHGRVQWARHGPAEAPKSPATPHGLGEPCPTCGKPKRAVTRPKRDAPPFAYCEPCRSQNGHSVNMPPFHLAGPPALGYYDDTRRTTR